MSAPDYLAAAAALFNTFTFERLVPTAVLIFLAAMFIWFIRKAQARDDFDVSMFLRNDRGTLDRKQLTTVMAYIVHTWYLFFQTVNAKVTWDDTALYVGAWGAIAVGLHGLDTLRAIKTGQPLPDNPMPPHTVHAPPPPETPP